MKRYIHDKIQSVDPPAKLSKFQQDVLTEENSSTREGRLMKAFESIKREDAVINRYRVNKSGHNFNIRFEDGRSLHWNSDRLPSDWLEALWSYATSELPQVSSRMYGEPGSLFDSRASTRIN